MRTILAAGCVLVLLVSTASGQDQEKGGGRPGGGGRFGGGRGGGPGGGMQDSLGILAMPEVQQELALEETKKKEVTDLVEKTRQEMMSSFNFRELQDLSQEERQKKFEESRKKNEEINKKALADLAKLLDAKQLERFHQLKLQREGVAALGQPEVAEKLALSQEQKDKIKKIQEEARSAGAPGGGGGGRLSEEERREFLAKREERQQKTNTDLLAVMTSAQKESWEKMLGKKFDFPQRQFGGGGGGRGRGGPGGGGGGREPAGEKKRPEAKKDA